MKILEAMWSNNKFGISAGIALFLLLAVLPLILGIGYALLYSLGVTGIVNSANGFTLAIWADILADSEIWLTFGYTFYIAVVSIGISLVIALGIVLLFADSLDRPGISYFFYLPLSIPAIVMAFYIFQVLGGSGLLSRISYALGMITRVQQFPGLINDLAGFGIITAHVLMATPFFIIFFHTIYRGEELAEMVQLASTLGAKAPFIDRVITIPILLQRGFSTILLYFIFVLGSYEIPLLLGREYPQMISILVINKLRRFNLADIPEAYGIAVMYTCIILAVLLITYRKRGLDYGK